MYTKGLKLLKHQFTNLYKYSNSVVLKRVEIIQKRKVSTHQIFLQSEHKTKFNTFKTFDDILSIHSEHNKIDFPYLWLRDNCQCKKCFHPISKSRIINWEHFDINVKPIKVGIQDGVVNIIWSDNHTSSFDIDWLYERSFLKKSRDFYTKSVYKLERTPWSKQEFHSIIKKFNYKSVLFDNSHLKEWLKNLSIYGVAFITDVDPSPDSCRKLANRVDFIKRTHYGEEFIVKAKPDTTNVAYMSSNLQLHTDLPYYEYKPGVNLLHCITQTSDKGGENLLCDGLYVANQLKENHNEYYKILTEIPVEWEDIGEENGNKFHSIYRSPVICLDAEGEISRINYSTPQRGSHLNISVEYVKPWYKSLKLFVDMTYKESAQYKLKEGEILCFDNRRLLHGRTEYHDTQTNIRYIIGAYLDWDFINSRIRVLNSEK